MNLKDIVNKHGGNFLPDFGFKERASLMNPRKSSLNRRTTILKNALMDIISEKPRCDKFQKFVTFMGRKKDLIVGLKQKSLKKASKILSSPILIEIFCKQITK